MPGPSFPYEPPERALAGEDGEVAARDRAPGSDANPQPASARSRVRPSPVRRPKPPSSDSPFDALVALQRSAGNAAVSAVLQRRSRTKEITGPYTDPGSVTALAAMPTQDLIDTFDDPGIGVAAKSLIAAPGALLALPDAAARDRITCALKACYGPIDPTFYITWSHLQVPDQSTIMARAERTQKGAGDPSRRVAVMGGGLIGMIRATAYEDAFALLNGLSMAEILTTLLSARGAAIERAAGKAGPALTALADLKAHLGAAVGVNIERIRVAIEAVLFAGADYPAFETAQPAVLGPALQDADRAAVKAFMAGSGVADFQAMLKDPQLFTQGQFFWSNELANSMKTHPDRAKLTAVAATAFDAMVDEAHSQAATTGSIRKAAAAFTAAGAAGGATAALLAMTRERWARALSPRRSDPQQRKVFAKKTTEFYGGLGLYNMLSGSYLGSGTEPSLGAHQNVFKLHYLLSAEAEVCGMQANFLAQLFRKKARAAGRPEPDPKARIGGLMLASGHEVKDKPFTVRGESVTRGEVCTYGAGLASGFAKICAALDAGWLVHIRVMSGWGGGYPGGEHSLMVIGHQGNVLTASDSDPGGELDRILKTGFTQLYYDPSVPRLSTAVNDEEFPVLAPGSGFHRNHHHRYQVLSVSGCV